MEDSSTTVAAVTAVVALITAAVTCAVAVINLRQAQEARQAAGAGATTTAEALKDMAGRVDDLSSTIERHLGPVEARLDLLVNLLRDMVGRRYPSERAQQ